MRTTVTVDDDLFAAIETLAKASGRRFSDVLSELARRGLARTAPQTNAGRFATFAVDPAAPVITAQRVREALDDDAIV